MISPARYIEFVKRWKRRGYAELYPGNRIGKNLTSATLSRKYCPPLLASPAPVGGGGACDLSVLPVRPGGQRNGFLLESCPPFSPALPPVGGGGACDSPVLPVMPGGQRNGFLSIFVIIRAAIGGLISPSLLTSEPPARRTACRWRQFERGGGSGGHLVILFEPVKYRNRSKNCI